MQTAHALSFGVPPCLPSYLSAFSLLPSTFMRAPDRIDIARRALGQALANPYTWAPFVPVAGAYAFIGAPWWLCLPTALAVGGGVATAWTRYWGGLLERVRTEAMADYRQRENSALDLRIEMLARSANNESRFVIALREAVGIKRHIEDRLFGDGSLTEHEEEVNRMIADLVRTMVEEAERLPSTLGDEFRLVAERFEKAAKTLRQAHSEIDMILDPVPLSLRTPVREQNALSKASERLSERIEEARGVRRFLEERLPAPALDEVSPDKTDAVEPGPLPET